MHVFLTETSGYIGSAVADRLRAANHVVASTPRGGGIPAEFVDSAPEGRRSAPAGTLLLAVNRPSYPVKDVVAAASRGAGAGGRTNARPLEEARETLGAYADALVLDQQATGKRAQELLGWRPSRPDVIADIEHGSYLKKG